MPELANLVKEQEEAFMIEMITPAGWDFWISSAGEEITVGFAEYHCHFGWHEGTNPEEDATQAVGFIRSFQLGNLVLAAWYERGVYASGCPMEATRELPVQTWFQRWRRRKQTLQIKKWA
jgi:hypothetical protein